MSIIDTLVTDRIPGATYDWKDMNRVAEAMEFVAAHLRAHGWIVEVTPRRFTREDFPTEVVFEHYLAQLQTLRRIITLFITTPAVPAIDASRPYMTVQEANDIEKILVDIENALQRTAAAFYYSGEGFAGEV